MFCAQRALYHALAKAVEEGTELYIPRSLDRKRLAMNTNIDLQEVCNGVVGPLTNETLTTYTKVINSPVL